MSKKQQPIQRLPIPVEEADVNRGLSELQARQRLESGWGNTAGQGVGKSEREIILSNIFTFIVFENQLFWGNFKYIFKRNFNHADFKERFS